MGSDIRVLLVEDNEMFREVAASELEREGEIVVTDVGSAEEALERLDEARFDCIVSDYRLPQQDGLSFLDTVRERWPEKPFVLFTVAQREEVASEAIQAGATEYLEKSGGRHQFDLLRNRITNAVRANRAAAAAKHQQELLQNIVNSIEDPLFLFDRTNSFELWNDAFRDVTGYTDSEIDTMNPEELVGGKDISKLSEAIDRIDRTGSARFEVDIVTKDGARLPYEVSATVLQTEDGLVGICGTGRDVTERNRRERQLTALNQTARDLLEATTETEIASIAVDTAIDHLEFQQGNVYTLDEATGQLRAVVKGSNAEDQGYPTRADGAGAQELIDDDNSLAWEAFVESEVRFETLEDGSTVEFYLPLGRHGILVIETTQERAATETCRTLAEIHAANVESALDRTRREQLLRERDRTLEHQNEQLERRNRINAVLRNVDRAVIHTSTPAELEGRLCEQLAAIDPFAFAWVGDVDPIDGSVTPKTHAGTDDAILDELTVTLDGDTSETTGMSASSSDITVVNNLLENRNGDGQQWRNAALRQGYRSVATIPLRHDEAIHGVLQIFAGQVDAFDDETATVLAELGEVVGFAITAANRKYALLSDTVVELDVHLPVEDGPFTRLAREADDVELQSLLPQEDGSTLTFFTVTGLSPGRVFELAEETDAIDDLTLISERPNRALFKCRSTVETVPSTIANYGGDPRRITASTGGIEAVIELPRSANIRQFVQTLTSTYPETEVRAQRDRSRPERSKPLYERLDSQLTPRQWEVLQAAYFSGMFEWPRDATGEEVAEMLDITPPTFHQHLRSAERQLLDTLF